MQKRSFVKVYTQDPSTHAFTYVGTLNDVADYQFNEVINGGLGALRLRLSRKVDDFDEGGLINWGNKVKITVADKNSPTGIDIYSGYMVGWKPTARGGSEYVDLICFGYWGRFAKLPYKDGADVTIQHSSAKPSDVIKDIVDKLRVVDPSLPVNYAADSVDETSELFSYPFDSLMGNEAIDKVLPFAQASGHFYLFLGADDIIQFKEVSSTATHRFTYGKDVTSFDLDKSAIDTVSNVLFYNQASLSRNYHKDTYVDDYGVNYTRLSDGRITDATYAEMLSEANIDSKIQHNEQLRFRVVDNNYETSRGYNINTIHPGDTCMVQNFIDSNIVTDNMLITSVLRTQGYTDIVVQDIRDITGRELSDIRRQLNSQVYTNSTPNYTDVDLT